MHGKGALIAPIFQSTFGATVQEIAVETDHLGSFSGEIARINSPLETARKKALLASTTGKDGLLLASEGSIGTDPLIPFINSDIELLLFIDEERGIEIVETLRSTEIVAVSQRFLPSDDLQEFLQKADFPIHKLMVKSTDLEGQLIFKEIDTPDNLERAITACSDQSTDRYALVESDLRAHCSPSRQRNIRTVALALATRINNLCPACQSPGWGAISYIKGVPCSDCLQISAAAVRAHIFNCVSCSHSQEGEVLRNTIEPALCNWCNP